MQNVIVCKSCGSENPFYEIICKKCHSFLREKISNIDLWNTVSGLIDTPVRTFKIIIQSEHKNFISLIFILAAFKLFITSVFMSLSVFRNENATNLFLPRLFYFSSGFLVLIILISVVLFLILKKGSVQTRFKDIFAVLTYSFIPYSFAAIILFSIEMIIFGGDLFSVNPSPYVIKNFLAWFLTIIEFLLILWSLFLLISGIYSQTKSKYFSVISGLIINIVIFASIYFYSIYLAL
jgi:hypothetical protein